MRSSRVENLCEHSMEAAIIVHCLCVISNVRYGKNLDANKAAVLYHDATEIITGDMPTPVKYFNEQLKTAYKDVEVLTESLYPLFPKALLQSIRSTLPATEVMKSI